MKRLTISMSDELFERLNEIENKSLFVRNTIERELSSGVVDSNEGLAERLNEVEIQLESIQSMLQSITPRGEIEKMVSAIEEKLVEKVVPEPEIAMPKLTPAEEAPQQPPFAMPELKPAEEAPQQPPFVMPELKPAEEVPTAPPMAAATPPPPIFEPSAAPAHVPPSVPPTPPQPVGKPDKLEGNILMYMPRGAEIKKSTIKSLLSKRYEPHEIDGKINQLISAGTLSSTTKDGADYLVRV